MQRNAPPKPTVVADRDSENEMATAITSQEELIAQAAANGQPIPARFQRSGTPPPVPVSPAASYGPPPSRQPPPPLSSGVVAAPVSSVPPQQQVQPSWAPPQMTPAPSGSVAMRSDLGSRQQRSNGVLRSRAYSFVLDARGQPVELGSGRFAKAYLGEERWLESKTDFRRDVVIKILQKGVSDEDRMRFQMEKELLERVQGHPNIVAPLRVGRGRRHRVHPARRSATRSRPSS